MEGTGLLVVIFVIVLIIGFFIVFKETNLSDSDKEKQEKLLKERQEALSIKADEDAMQAAIMHIARQTAGTCYKCLKANDILQNGKATVWRMMSVTRGGGQVETFDPKKLEEFNFEFCEDCIQDGAKRESENEKLQIFALISFLIIGLYVIIFQNQILKGFNVPLGLALMITFVGIFGILDKIDKRKTKLENGLADAANALAVETAKSENKKYFSERSAFGESHHIYFKKGQLWLEGNYNDGKRDGLYEEYYENGQLKIKVNYKDGEPDGLSELYFENGQLRAKVNFKDGEYDGLFEAYYENGQLKAKRNFKDGELDGLSELYDENGQLKVKRNYKDGILINN